MSGRLILLPKKSWNVFNPKNIARVQRDEQRAKEIEDGLKTAAATHDAEHTHELLRAKALKRLGLDPDAKDALLSSSSSSSSSTTKQQQQQQQQPVLPTFTFDRVLRKRKRMEERNGYHTREDVRKSSADPLQGLARARAHKQELRARAKRQRTTMGSVSYIVDRSGRNDVRKKEKREKREKEKKEKKEKKSKKKKSKKKKSKKKKKRSDATIEVKKRDG